MINTNELKLVEIPAGEYPDYRYRVIFGAYKWDPQVGDSNTVAKHALLMSRTVAAQIESYAETLFKETIEAEFALMHRPDLLKDLSLPRGITSALKKIKNYQPEHHVRLMRFDFHPTTEGWKISEVNSDVPGGFAEASVLPKIAVRYFDGYSPRHDAAEALYRAFAPRIAQGGTVAFVHCTSYSDDRQVMQCLGDYFTAHGLRAIFAAPDHIVWRSGRAVSILEGNEGEIDGIVRFFPLEWMTDLSDRACRTGFFASQTPSCNHPVAMLVQSKRLPLVWDRLEAAAALPLWKSLLPKTVPPKAVDKTDPSWIYKPALGRVGEGITIREAMTAKMFDKTVKAARRYHKDFVAQKRFDSIPLDGGEQTFHLCIGAFVIDGKAAGFYGRISPHARIDAGAKDIPILVEDF